MLAMAHTTLGRIHQHVAVGECCEVSLRLNKKREAYDPRSKEKKRLGRSAHTFILDNSTRTYM